MNAWQRRFVRTSLSTVVLLWLAFALWQPTLAGTQAVPEITDPRNDQEALGTVPITMQPPTGTSVGLSVDLEAGWVSEPTADTFLFTVDVAGTGGASINAEQEWRFHFTLGATSYVASARTDVANQAMGLPGSGTTAPGGVATAVTNAGDGFIILTVPKSAVGNPVGGTVMTGLFIEAESFLGGVVPGWITDRAPNSGNGQDYIVSGGGNATVPGDSDGDLLNDTCEQEFFGGLNATDNATADPDGDGLTNGQECAGNPRTDPTKADTDGDGVNDDQDPFPTDPSKGGSASGSPSASSSGSRSSSASGSKSGSVSGSGSSTGSQDEAQSGGKGEVKDLSDAVERLKSDAGYLGTSAGGLLAVLVLAILALAVRWSL